jgi:hypothetical protein
MAPTPTPVPTGATHFAFGFVAGIAPAQLMTDYALAVAATCEADFQRIAGLFGTGNSFGPSNRIEVVVDANLDFPKNSPAGALAQNNGFHSDGTTMITLAGSSPLFPLTTQQGIYDGLRAAFVSELTEIFLDLRSQSTAALNRGYSDGEALSRVLAANLHASGYYEVIGRTDAYGRNAHFPASHWLSAPQRAYKLDYVTEPSTTDGDPMSIGCGILFLYYLHTQLRTPWSAIIDNLGRTLADTYANLGHGPRESAFDDFNNKLQAVFPPGSNVDYNLPYEDVFPLLDPSRERLELDVGAPGPPVDHFGDVEVVSEGPVDVAPGPLCPVGQYVFHILRLMGTTSVTATAFGFGQPDFSWQVDGHQADPLGSITIPFHAEGWDEDPHKPGLVSRSADIDLRVGVTSTDPHTSILQITAGQGAPAQFDVPVAATVTERAAGGAARAQQTWAGIKTTELRWDPPFDEDKRRCEKRLRDILQRYRHMREIRLLLTLPDPPHMLQSISHSEEIRNALRALAAEDGELADDLGRYLGFRGTE